MTSRIAPRAPGGGRPSPVREDRFPVALVLEALEGWARDPDTSGERLADAIRLLVQAAAARGVFVRVEAPPLASFDVGSGTLPAAPAAPEAPGLAWYRLRVGEGRILGDIWLDAPGPRAEEIVRLLALAVDAAWARAAVDHTAARLRALDDATRAIAGELDLDRVLQLMVDSVRGLIHARYAALGILDANGRIERFITSGLSRDERLAIGPPPRGHGVLGLIIRDGVALRISDIRRHPDGYGFPEGHPPMRSFLGAPVRIAGVPIGNFYLADKEGAVEFAPEDQELLEMFAIHAGIAIHNARLHARVQQLAIVDERIRIGRDLHDGIIQGIYAVALSLEDVPDLVHDDVEEASARVDRAIDRLNTTIRDIRTFIVGLSSAEPEVTLATTLAALVGEIHLDRSVDVELDLADADEIAHHLAPEALHELVQIAREALSNVARHSAATRLRLALRREGDRPVLEIADDGRGFDPTVRPAAGHFGLANLRDRAVTIGGELGIESRPGAGTRIIVRLPSLTGDRLL